MAIVTCAKCGFEKATADFNVGRLAKCPKCGDMTTVTKDAPTETDAAVPEPASAAEEEPPKDSAVDESQQALLEEIQAIRKAHEFGPDASFFLQLAWILLTGVTTITALLLFAGAIEALPAVTCVITGYILIQCVEKIITTARDGQIRQTDSDRRCSYESMCQREVARSAAEKTDRA